jgi:hypothetical protein
VVGVLVLGGVGFVWVELGWVWGLGSRMG